MPKAGWRCDAGHPLTKETIRWVRGNPPVKIVKGKTKPNFVAECKVCVPA